MKRMTNEQIEAVSKGMTVEELRKVKREERYKVYKRDMRNNNIMLTFASIAVVAVVSVAVIVAAGLIG